MSRVLRRKHVIKEMMDDDFELPKEHQTIVRVVCSRGNNLHEVESADVNVEKFLVSMPSKFRNNVWVKRGDFVLVDPIEEGNKVKAEISKILTPEHIKEYMKASVWPKRFTNKREHSDEEQTNESDEDGFRVKNLNRPATETPETSDDNDTDSSSDTENEIDGVKQ